MTDLINGRTPEEIKRNLSWLVRCNNCPQNHEYGCDYENRTKECQTTDDALALIERLEAAQSKWISVKERLPEHRQHVYACAKDKFRFEGVYIDPVGFERYEIGEGWVNENRNVTHWMPLPEPPKEDAHG